MTRFPFLIVLLIWAAPLAAQPSNAWVKFDQDYYKIPVAKEGIYKISYTALQQAGLTTGTADPRNFQLFHRGVQQAIQVTGESDGVFNADDVITFYGQQNDGTLDEYLYSTPDLQPHQYYNIYSDSTSYFLTVGPESGKRMQMISDDQTGLTARAYHIEEKHLVLAEQYNAGPNIRNQIFSSHFEKNEGWTSRFVKQGTSKVFEIQGITGLHQDPDLQIEIMLVGRSVLFHTAELTVGPSLRLLKNATFSHYDKVVIREPLTTADISAGGKIRVQLRVPSNGYEDQVSVSYIKIRFRQTYNAANAEKLFRIPSAPEPSLIEIAQPPAGAQLYDVTDKNEVRMIAVSGTNPLKGVVPASIEERKLLLTANPLVPARIKKVRFRAFPQGVHDYVILSHSRLRQPAGNYADPVEAFSAYRSSPEGGGFNTLVVNIDELYDQFSYGEVSPLAIYGFLRHLSTPIPPSYLFIIGKGLEISFQFHRQANNSSLPYPDLIPVGGHPGSDAIYSTNINGSGTAPAISTGRISARFPSQVAAYLDKVREMELPESHGLWKKNLLHLSGGIEEGEPERFRGILAEFGAVAEGPLLGGKVTAMAKTSRDLAVVNASAEINAGVGLVTFFGHASTTAFDFDIGLATDPAMGYDNKGKYPVLLMNGCHTGAFFRQDSVSGENWVFARDKGASAFIAHNYYATEHDFHRYSGIFYNVAFADPAYFGKSIGDIHRETAKRFLAESGTSINDFAQAYQMMILGDPALKLFPVAKPDYEVTESQVSLVSFPENEQITAQSDSFAIRIILRNYGMAVNDTFRINVQRVFQDNTSVNYDTLVPAPFHSDTLLLVIRNGSTSRGGTNTFHVMLDADDLIAEENEMNNTASYSYVIPSNGTKNLFPSQFAIVNDPEVRFAFQATDLYSEERSFILQVDTVNTFNSPFLQETEITGKVLASHTMTLPAKDSVAYYWRTRLNDVRPDEFNGWDMNSFSFIADSEEGWAQIHFPQLLDNSTSGLALHEESRSVEFERSVTPLQLVNWGITAGKAPSDVSVKIKGVEYNVKTRSSIYACRDNTFNLIAFDKKSTSPYIGVYLKWYELSAKLAKSCGREPMVINSFRSDEVNNGGFRDVIHYVNNVTEGDSVVMFSIGDPQLASWHTDVRNKLAELGVSGSQLAQIQAGEPFVIFGKKGAVPGSAVVHKTSSPDALASRLEVNGTISGGFDHGSMVSSLIGPASSWKDVSFNVTNKEEKDQVLVDVIGVRKNGVESTLVEGVSDGSDISSIDASAYPYLRLRFVTADTMLLTSAQLNQWIIHFTPTPEGVLLPDGTKETKVLQEGEVWTSSYRFVNISETAFADSLQVDVRLFNHNTSDSRVEGFRIPSPAPADTTHFVIAETSKGLVGLNDVRVIVNPHVLPEAYYDNNVLQLSQHLDVRSEERPPVIEVSIDGRIPRNGDYVAANPTISIRVWDENVFLPMTDTLGVQMLLTYPCKEDCVPQRIWFSRPDVAWHPANPSSPFEINFTPSKLPAGEYQLQVRSRDRSGNETEPYILSFFVEDRRSYSLLHPYPNPMSTFVSFGFVLTSEPIPAKLEFVVLDLTGRLVYSSDIPNSFHVGRNEFTWKAEDSHGNRLKSGAYVYRLRLIDATFTIEEFGKLLIAE